MNDAQLLRYSRHIFLDELGIEAQQLFLDAHILMIGAGGLGAPAALYLAAAGIGTLTLVDGDTVDLANLQRQIIYATETVGQPKVTAARAALLRLNPEIHVNALAVHADASLLDEWVARANVVLDCTDDFATRHIINQACLRHRKPLVSGAALRFDGQISTFDLRLAHSPCYACLFPAEPAPTEMSCSRSGVFAPLVGMIGSMQAAEALRLIAHAEAPLSGRLLSLDALHMHWRLLHIAQQPDCAACGAII
ncbi:ThiF protein [Mycoavidus cysteinexigens]|uniref:Molybdopterin-synthase adenylyltransferase n=1 Tax=Mycoavidus cysteinexigens TaxID=1553431 RepID=A0A2Z6EXW4_9BURK|nr:HesA/MoeB/ThiF family protein [Mycoavidus cysteinexigens]BBE10303.1 ThiF protein [Mycoavidus cysteinexigens]GAM53326.1 sulfur carrier protein adenylyltransferase ThiF [bacterium endosymbiont of Mortierella elongata FMR23-6]GLR00720.1 molybdopterin biosynthesis protein MoeB [Mycoavidus cysteinexigens]